MIRENFAAVYQKLAKDCKANVVPELNTALKNIDKEKDLSKLKGLIDKAEAQLEKAIRDIGKIADQAAKDNKPNVKKLATQLETGLKLLKTNVSKFDKVVDKEAKEGKGAGGPSDKDIKDSVEVGKQLSKTDDQIADDLREFGRLRVLLWGDITKFGEKRWKCIKNYCKSQGISANGFRSFPMAIDIMVDECKNANPSAGKALKGGGSQTILVDEDDAKESDVRGEFTKYSAAECKSELNRVVEGINKLDKKLDAITKNVDKLSASADKMRQEAKDLGKGGTADKITAESGKLKSFASNFKGSARKADDAINALHKLVIQNSGLGASDGDIRDAFEEIPHIEKLNKDIKSSVNNLEGYMKDIQVKKARP